ncbi:ABC-type bacteriocin/lantibiotic exporter with double-glycine peptidase domain [Prosthecobacter fusiformis]|uniref:ABC-type bacteriocin/lantibiotic exporter with double-glycine peptidase domain n=1 Tax=Prosthecobacter fusiformis TaxID=48464 RepID=A0A4R7SRD8_9BACT|nr:ATP-binding cassette domain-containing protein [Prosthecobacter fusiformis]TDU81245.1 ABC-type bacteriocin/lantibiotic exporter with double-glycine peptidase domain [Prosthecobacter fusiformis]
MPSNTPPGKLPTEQPSLPLSASLLAQLSAITGTEYDHERAKIAIRNATRADAEPLSLLVSAASEVYMNVSPVRMPLADLVWQAHNDTPVVIWSVKEQNWIIITFAGWLRLRIADGEDPHHRRTITRKELVKRLGLVSAEDVVEAGVVQPERAAHDMSVHAAHARHAQMYGSNGHGHHRNGHGNGHGNGHLHVSPVTRFFRLLKAERQDILTLLIFSVFSGILYLAAPLAVDAVVSNLAFGGQSQPYFQALVIVGFALLAALSLQAVITGLQYFVSDIIQRRIFVRAAADLAYRLPRVRAESLEGVHAPELVNRFLDVVTAQKSTSLLLLDGINLFFGSLIGMMLLALYHPLLLLFVAVLLVLIVLVLWLCGRGAVETSIAESRTKYDLVNWFEEIAAYPFLFKGPGGYHLAYERSNQLASEYVTRRAAHFRVVMRQIIGLLVLSVLAGAALLVMGGWLVVSQQITLGQLVASELIMSAIVASLAKLGKKLEAWYDVMAAMDKLGHIFDLEIERESGEQPVKRESGASVVADGLTFGYTENSPLFLSRTFTIRPGSRVAIVGPHGAGASSLLDILFGLRTPTGGHVCIDGLDLRSWYLEALRDHVQLLRRDEIVDATVVENLRLGRADIGMDEIREALERVGLLDTLLARPEGLNLRLKIGGAPLSGNQRTRLLLARSLVQRPRLLLIDELFDSLDPESFASLSAAILDKSLPWTVVLTTRDHDVTQLCDQVIQLSPCNLTDGSASTQIKG